MTDRYTTHGISMTGLKAATAKAVETDHLHREKCANGASCTITPTSRRETMNLGGKPYVMVFCDVCGVGRQDA